MACAISVLQQSTDKGRLNNLDDIHLYMDQESRIDDLCIHIKGLPDQPMIFKKEWSGMLGQITLAFSFICLTSLAIISWIFEPDAVCFTMGLLCTGLFFLFLFLVSESGPLMVYPTGLVLPTPLFWRAVLREYRFLPMQDIQKVGPYLDINDDEYTYSIGLVFYTNDGRKAKIMLASGDYLKKTQVEKQLGYCHIIISRLSPHILRLPLAKREHNLGLFTRWRRWKEAKERERGA